MSAEIKKNPTHPLLDTLGINGLFKDGINGFLTQLAFPAVYQTRTLLEEHEISVTRKALTATWESLGALTVIAMATRNIETALAVKGAFNLVTNMLIWTAMDFREYPIRKEFKKQA